MCSARLDSRGGVLDGFDGFAGDRGPVAAAALVGGVAGLLARHEVVHELRARRQLFGGLALEQVGGNARGLADLHEGSRSLGGLLRLGLRLLHLVDLRLQRLDGRRGLLLRVPQVGLVLVGLGPLLPLARLRLPVGALRLRLGCLRGLLRASRGVRLLRLRGVCRCVLLCHLRLLPRPCGLGLRPCGLVFGMKKATRADGLIPGLVLCPARASSSAR